MTDTSTPETYRDRLLSELRAIEEHFASIIAASTINYTNPNRAGSGIVFIGAADFGWGPSLEISRGCGLDRRNEWRKVLLAWDDTRC